MRFVHRAVLLVALPGLAGCIPLFLHPGYSANEVVVESALVGTWVVPGNAGNAPGPDTLSFQLEKDRSYRVTIRNDGNDPESLVFLGHRFRAGAVTLMDLEPHPASPVAAFYVPAHTFWRADLSGDTLVWGGLDESWAVAAAHRPGSGCPVDTVDVGGNRNVVLTGRTPAVRRLLERAAADTKAFSTQAMLRLEAPGGR